MSDKLETWVAMDDGGWVLAHGKEPWRDHGEWLNELEDYVRIDPALAPDLTPDKPRRVIGLVLAAPGDDVGEGE